MQTWETIPIFEIPIPIANHMLKVDSFDGQYDEHAPQPQCDAVRLPHAPWENCSQNTRCDVSGYQIQIQHGEHILEGSEDRWLEAFLRFLSGLRYLALLVAVFPAAPWRYLLVESAWQTSSSTSFLWIGTISIAFTARWWRQNFLWTSYSSSLNTVMPPPRELTSCEFRIV